MTFRNRDDLSDFVKDSYIRSEPCPYDDCDAEPFFTTIGLDFHVLRNHNDDD